MPGGKINGPACIVISALAHPVCCEVSLVGDIKFTIRNNAPVYIVDINGCPVNI